MGPVPSNKTAGLAAIGAIVLLSLIMIARPGHQAVINTSAAVQVPEVINAAIQLGITALLTAGFVWLFNTLGLDLRSFALPISLAVSGFITSELQNVINVIPMNYDIWLLIIFQAITIILAPVGLFMLVYHRNELHVLPG